MPTSADEDGGGWETAPTRQSKKKGSNHADNTNQRGGGRHSGPGRGRGGFGGWAKPKPPRPQPNAGWPSPPQSHYTSQQSEMLMVSSSSSPSAGAVAAGRTNGQNSKEKELTYLDAVPKRELTEATLDTTVAADDSSPGASFRSLLTKTSLADLMADYGEEDRDFAKMAVVTSEGEDAGGPNDDASRQSNKKEATQHNQRQRQRQNESSGVLAPHGKAPIHVELVSYGHHYGVPPEAAGKQGGYSRSRPLPPFDVRDLRRAPHHVAKLSGLSHHVKRELLNPREIEEEGEDGGDGGDDGDGGVAAKTVQFEADKRSPVRRRAEEVAEESAAALAEAIEDGSGHGSPLDMTVYIGSEYGRHRSVVIVEAAAISLRNMLRRNERDRFGSTPVSVGTRHRDVDRAHRDEEAFGYDLRREALAAKKQKEKEEKELGGRW